MAVRWPDRCWAVKGAHGIGRALAQRLVGDGEQVVDVPAKLAARVRVLSVGHGRKSDPDDAVSVVVAARNARGLRQVGVEDRAVVLHLLTKRRQNLVAARTQTINRLHRLLMDLVPGGARRNLTAKRAAELLARSQTCRRAGGHPLAAGQRARGRRAPPGPANHRGGGADQDRGPPRLTPAWRSCSGSGRCWPPRSWRGR